MKNLILVTHAEFAKGIITSADLILGGTESIKYVSISAKETVINVVKAIRETMESFQEKAPVIIVTDIAGGSTTQAAMQVMNKQENTYVVTGLNLGMLLEIICADISNETGKETCKEILRDIVNNSKETIQLANDLLEETEKSSNEELEEL